MYAKQVINALVLYLHLVNLWFLLYSEVHPYFMFLPITNACKLTASSRNGLHQQT